MNAKHKKIYHLMFMAITFFMVVVPTVHEYQDLVGCEFLSPIRSIETSIRTAHPQQMASSQWHRFAGVSPNISPLMPFAAPNCFEEAFLSPFPIPLSSKPTSVLRR